VVDGVSDWEGVELILAVVVVEGVAVFEGVGLAVNVAVVEEVGVIDGVIDEVGLLLGVTPDPHTRKAELLYL
jgi:hypothetical protein